MSGSGIAIGPHADHQQFARPREDRSAITKIGSGAAGIYRP
jgi:hypothetical protein